MLNDNKKTLRLRANWVCWIVPTYMAGIYPAPNVTNHVNAAVATNVHARATAMAVAVDTWDTLAEIVCVL